MSALDRPIHITVFPDLEAKVRESQLLKVANAHHQHACADD